MNARRRWEARCQEAGVALMLGPMLAVIEAPTDMWAVVGYALVASCSRSGSRKRLKIRP